MKTDNQPMNGSLGATENVERWNRDMGDEKRKTHPQGLTSAAARGRFKNCGRDAPKEKQAGVAAKIASINTGLFKLPLMLLLCVVALPSQAESYGPTKPGDDLWDIVRRVHPEADVTRDQAMLAISKANPQAFSISCNAASYLLNGMMLQIPSEAEMQALSKAAAEQTFARQLAEWKAHQTTGQAIVCPPVSEETGAVATASAGDAPKAPAVSGGTPAAETGAAATAPAGEAPKAPAVSGEGVVSGMEKEATRAIREVEDIAVSQSPWLGLLVVVVLLFAVMGWVSHRKKAANIGVPSRTASVPGDLEKLPVEKTLAALKTTSQGLTTAEAKQRLEQYGRNELEEKQVSDLEKFLHYFWGPIPWMIEIAAVLSAMIGHWADFSIIMVLLLYNAVSGFWQERKAANALAALKAGMAPKAEVLRDGKFAFIDAAEVVPGDMVRIKLGEVVPADVRFTDGEYISIDQAALTGESLPVSKQVGDSGYSGSIAKKGEMTAVVIGTGNNTFFGRTASLVASAGAGTSHSQKAVTQIGDFLIILCLILALILAGFMLYRDIVVTHPWQWSDLMGILRMVLVLLIASIPVAMPTVMTVTNALGALALSRKKAIVSRLEAIEELAGVDILCSDKTGTLTKNQLTLGEPILFAADDAQKLILAGALASQRDGNDPIDLAVIAGLQQPTLLDGYQLSKFLPFDPVSKRTEGDVIDAQGKPLRYTKGAPQVIIDLCALDGDTKTKAEQAVADLAAKGMRALGVAESTDDGKRWNFLGILSMLDPPRDDSKETIRRAEEHGLQVKMVTGDDVAIGSEIASELGMGTHLQAAADLFTKEMDMSHLPEPITECVEKADGFGRVFPEHKYAIVKALQDRGHVVAMTGDGVNDAPALKQADCGVAVSGATDAARAAAALILTQPGLSTIVDAIDEARRIFERIINYVLFRVSMTLDIMFVVVLATIFFGFSPLTPVMIVILALLDDVPIMTIAYDNTLLPKEPVRWHMRKLLLGSSLMGLFSVVQTFGLLLIGMEWLTNPEWQSWIRLTQEQIQTIIFLQIVAGGHLLLFVVRSRGRFFGPPWPATPLFIAVVGTQIFAVLMCGFGWFVTQIPWTIIGLVWLYMLIWMFVLDEIKLALYRHIAHGESHRPRWYARFLEGRSAGHALASTGNVGPQHTLDTAQTAPAVRGGSR